MSLWLLVCVTEASFSMVSHSLMGPCRKHPAMSQRETLLRTWLGRVIPGALLACTAQHSHWPGAAQPCKAGRAGFGGTCGLATVICPFPFLSLQREQSSGLVKSRGKDHVEQPCRAFQQEPRAVQR